MNYLVAFAASAVAVWAALASFDAPLASDTLDRPRSAGTATHVDVAVGTGNRRVAPWSPRRTSPTNRDAEPSVDPFERLKAADPWTADNLRQAMELGLERLVRDARANHDGDPAACVPGLELLPTTALVEARADHVVVSIGLGHDARIVEEARRCILDYFAGRVEIADEEVGGPLPLTSFEIEYPLPAHLSERLRKPPVGS